MTEQDRQLLLVRESQRLQMLAALYRLTGGDTQRMPEVDVILTEVDISQHDADLALNYLEEEALVKGFSSAVYGRRRLIKVQLTHRGVVEYESVLKRPDQATEHFTIQVVQHFYAQVGVAQAGTNEAAVHVGRDDKG